MAEESTVQLEVTLTLPDTVAREAEARGLLTAETLEALIKAEVQRRRVEQLFAAADRLAALPAASLTEAEVEAEIQAVRAERRAKSVNRS
jgi:hypothetical protein